jgi:glutaminase
MPNITDVLADITAKAKAAPDRGKVADYIPELAKVDPQKFAIAVVDGQGQLHTAGDFEEPFSIQSISKVFTLTLALGIHGDAIWKRVGREPSGSAFNSIVLLEHEHGIPRNPFINAGAIVITDLVLAGREPRESIGEILRFMRFLSDDDSIVVDERVAMSEVKHGDRNSALAHYMKSYGNLTNPVEKTLGVYFHQCAIAMNVRQLALAGRYLCHSGKHPSSGQTVISAERARRVKALMLTCGHYDASGEFAFRVGIPGKSGVGGGILAIVPGKASIAVWSPGLNEYGNSQLGSWALERLARAMDWSVFNPQH